MNGAENKTRFSGFKLCLAAMAAWGGLSLPSGAAAAEPPSAAGVEFFEKKVRPLLVKNCYECHGPEKQKAGLRLDSRAGWAKGGDSGPAIVPGKPDESLLIEAVRYASYEMPPTGKLPDEAIAVLERWVKLGAPDPRMGDPTETANQGADIEAGRQLWAYQPPVKHALPEVKQADWPRGEIDRFILAALEDKGLKPAEDAKPQALVRRVYFDLIGLPPTPEQIDAFEQSAIRTPHSAIERSSTSCSPRRASASAGAGTGSTSPATPSRSRCAASCFKEAWRYRDYVIDAFNRRRAVRPLRPRADRRRPAAGRDLADSGAGR